MAAVEALEETQRLFDLCPTMLSISSFEGYLLVVNPAWTATLGWSREELLSRPYRDFLHPFDREATTSAAERLLVGEPVKGFECRYRHRDGGYRWLSWDATSDVDRRLMYAAIRDVTEERRREARTAELEAVSGIGTWDLDLDGERVNWSPGTHRLHGTDPGSFDPSIDDALAFYPPPAREVLSSALERARREGTGYDLELPFRSQEGEQRWVRTTATTSRRHGRVIRIHGTIQNVTDSVEERQRLRRFRDLLELSEEGIAELDEQGRITYANVRFAALLGRDTEALLGVPFGALVVDDEAGRRVLSALEQRRDDDVVIRGEVRLATEPAERIVQVAARVEGAGGDTAGHATVVTTDVTERRRRELELRETTALLEQSQRTARIGHWRLDVRTGDLAASSVVSEIVADGEPLHTFRDYLRAVHPEDRGRLRADPELRNGRGDTNVVHRIRTPSRDERTVHLHVEAVRDVVNDRLVALRGTLQDVTAVYHTERALQRVLTATNDGWFDEDLVNGRTSYSDRWWEIHGRRPPSGPVAARTWRRYVRESELPEIDARVAQAVRERAPVLRFDGHVQHAQGHLVPVVVRVSIEYDRDGQPTRITGATSDVTEQVQAERAKEVFVSTVSHELRTPLTAIGGALELLEAGRGGTMPATARPLIEIGQRNTGRLHRLISDLLDIEQLRSGSVTLDLVLQPLHPIIRDTVADLRPLAEAASVGLVFAADDTDLSVRADAVRLAQVVTNLVSNAVKYSPEHTEVRVHLRRHRSRALLEVLDVGPGLPPRFRDRAFERFSQADPDDPRSRGGTGLGLAISREIVRQHHGQIGYDSAPGSTRFWVELPMAEPPEDPDR